MGNSTRIICSLDYITDEIYDHFFQQIHVSTAVYRRVLLILGSLRYGDYGLRTTAGRALSFFCSTGLSRANIER